MEAEYGSLTRGMLAAHKKMKAAMAARAAGAAAVQPAGGDRLKAMGGADRGSGGRGSGAGSRSIFTALRGGLQQLVDGLAAKIDGACVRLNTPVNAVERTDGGWSVTAGGVTENFDNVIMASPAWAAGAMLAGVDAELARDLEGIPYSSSITVNLVYDEAKLGRLPEGFGFLVPASAGRAMLACTFAHRKFSGRTAPGKAVLRAFLGGMRKDAPIEEPDEVLIGTVRRELSEILGAGVIGLNTEPELAQVTRWPRAMAQYAVGHKERMARIEERVAGLAGLKLAGNAYDGIGIPDCIRLGRAAAKSLVGATS
jgi:oxygen-dependent protoporphyrinogen oxidase